MTNSDLIRSMSDEQLAAFLARETYRIAEPIFELMRQGVTEEFLLFLRLKWLRQEVTGDENI